MRQSATNFVLLLWLIAVGSSVCYAQDRLPQNAAPNKTACDFLSKSEAESILGTPVEARGDDGYGCWFVETGWTNEFPRNKSVRFNVWYWASPQVNQFVETRKKRTQTQLATKVVKDLPNFADAAIWTWNQGWGGTLDAFKGGTIWVEVSIAGLPEEAALQQAKALAAKPLGGTAGTGYVYATPKGNTAPVVAETTPANGLVRKSKTYWDAYKSDIIRQVFDEGFGSDVAAITEAPGQAVAGKGSSEIWTG